MDGARFNLQGVSLDSKFFQDSGLVFYSGRKTNDPYNFHKISKALNENYFIKKGNQIKNKLIGEISHINVNLNLNPSLCYHPIFWKEGDKNYGLAKEIKLEVRSKDKWIEFLINKEIVLYNEAGLFLPERYFLQRPAKD